MPRGQHHRVLQHRDRDGIARSILTVGHQHIQMRAGDKKAGDPNHLVGAQRDRAHSIGNLACQAVA